MKLFNPIIRRAFVFLALLSTGAGLVHAASTMFLSPASQTVSSTATFSVNLMLNTNDQVNALQANLTFPSNLLTVTNIDGTGSAFSLQAEHSTGTGTIKIVRGNIVNVTGNNRLVAILTFRALGAGSAAVGFGAGSVVLRSTDQFNTLTGTTGGAYTLAAPDTTAPTLSNINAINIFQTSATITFTSNEPATHIIDYGTSTSYGLSLSSGSLMTAHARLLTVLTPGTTYNYRIRATDAAGNTVTSANRTFFTARISRRGDLNNDGLVDLTDLSILFRWWNSNNAAGDVNGDGAVDVYDLSILLFNWNTMPQSTQAFGAPGFSPRQSTAALSLAPRARTSADEPLRVDVFLESRVPVNTVQAALVFPKEKLEFLSADTADSPFKVLARQEVGDGSFMLAAGNIEPVQGKHRIATLSFKPLSNDKATLYFARGSQTLQASNNGNVLTRADAVNVSGQPSSQIFLTPVPEDGVNDAILFDADTVEVLIVDMNGRRVYEAASAAGATLNWAGRDDSGRPLPSGAYIAKIKKADGTQTYQTLVLAK